MSFRKPQIYGSVRLCQLVLRAANCLAVPAKTVENVACSQLAAQVFAGFILILFFDAVSAHLCNLLRLRLQSLPNALRLVQTGPGAVKRLDERVGAAKLLRNVHSGQSWGVLAVAHKV